MLSILFLILAAIAASDSINGTYVIANPITGADSAEQCRTGIGIPGAFYWCKEKNFSNNDHCDYWYPNKACWYMKSPENIRRSIAPDFGGYCKFWSGTECTGAPLNVIMGGIVSDRLICPGCADLSGTENTSMRCYAFD